MLRLLALAALAVALLLARRPGRWDGWLCMEVEQWR
jgi:hypothetical protein